MKESIELLVYRRASRASRERRDESARYVLVHSHINMGPRESARVRESRVVCMFVLYEYIRLVVVVVVV